MVLSVLGAARRRDDADMQRGTGVAGRSGAGSSCRDPCASARRTPTRARLPLGAPASVTGPEAPFGEAGGTVLDAIRWQLIWAGLPAPWGDAPGRYARAFGDGPRLWLCALLSRQPRLATRAPSSCGPPAESTPPPRQPRSAPGVALFVWVVGPAISLEGIRGLLVSHWSEPLHPALLDPVVRLAGQTAIADGGRDRDRCAIKRHGPSVGTERVHNLLAAAAQAEVCCCPEANRYVHRRGVELRGHVLDELEPDRRHALHRYSLMSRLNGTWTR